MSRGKATFTQSGTTRAVKSALAAGLEVVAIEVTQDGARVVTAAKGATAPKRGVSMAASLQRQGM